MSTSNFLDSILDNVGSTFLNKFDAHISLEFF